MNWLEPLTEEAPKYEWVLNTWCKAEVTDATYYTDNPNAEGQLVMWLSNFSGLEGEPVMAGKRDRVSVWVQWKGANAEVVNKVSRDILFRILWATGNAVRERIDEHYVVTPDPALAYPEQVADALRGRTLRVKYTRLKERKADNGKIYLEPQNRVFEPV